MHATIRDAVLADLDAINEIYNHYVAHSVATFDEQPISAEQRLEWWRALEGRYPVLMLADDGRTVGWAALVPYSGRCAYRQTVENSVYIAPQCCGRGHGRALLTALLERGGVSGFHSVIAKIAADQGPSLRLHTRLGFREVGRLVEVGHKFDRWLDVLILQRML